MHEARLEMKLSKTCEYGIKLGMELGFEDVTLWIRGGSTSVKRRGENSRGQVLQQLGPLASPFRQRHSQLGGPRGLAPLKYYFYCFYFVAIMINFVLDNHLILMRMYRVCSFSWRVEITVFCLFTLLLIKRDRN